MWIARDEDNWLFLYRDKPVKAEKSWESNDSLGIVRLPGKMFPEIQWSDEEPTEVELVIKK